MRDIRCSSCGSVVEPDNVNWYLRCCYLAECTLTRDDSRMAELNRDLLLNLGYPDSLHFHGRWLCVECRQLEMKLQIA